MSSLESEGPSRRVGVVGATGAVGAEIVKVLDRASWRPDVLVPLARASTSMSHVEYGDERVPVDDVADEAMEGLDALILAVPESVAEELAEPALDEGVPVVDLSGALRGRSGVALAVPWVNPEALLGEEVPLGVSLPGPEALLLASVLGPLQRAGIVGALRASVLLPASVWGRGGIEELAGQVRALFNGEAPPRRVFEQGLAFDVLPAVAGREARVAEEVGRILSLAPSHLEIEAIGVPVFSGLSASLVMHPARRVDPALVAKVLSDGGVVVAEGSERSVPRPRSVEGKPFAHVGRIRVDDDGALRIWCAMDNLRTAATAAVATAGAMLSAGSRA